MTARPADERRTYLGAYAACVRAGSILLAHVRPGRSPSSHEWTLPGGGVDFGEHPEQAVLRELREESGLTGSVQGVLGIYTGMRPRTAERPPLHHVGVLYDVAAAAGELAAETDGSTDYCAWTPLAEAGELDLTPLARCALELLGARDRFQESAATEAEPRG